jgi:hypothetical protein
MAGMAAVFEMILCPWNLNCLNKVHQDATQCHSCGGSGSKKLKECPECTWRVFQQAHVCGNCRHSFQVRHYGNVCPQCQATNHQRFKKCSSCQTQLKGKTKHATSIARRPKKKGPFEADAAKEQTVIRVVAEEDIYSVCFYPSGEAYRDACKFEQDTFVRKGVEKGPQRICNRLQCINLTQFGKVVQLPSEEADGGHSDTKAALDLGGQVASQKEDITSSAASSTVDGENLPDSIEHKDTLKEGLSSRPSSDNGLYCKHLQLISDALFLEKPPYGSPIRGPLDVLPLKTEVLAKLIEEHVVFRKRAEALVRAAKRRVGLERQEPNGEKKHAAAPAAEQADNGPGDDGQDGEHSYEAGFFTSLLHGQVDEEMLGSPKAESTLPILIDEQSRQFRNLSRDFVVHHGAC